MRAVIRCLTIFAMGGLLAACGEPVSPPGTPVLPPQTSIQDGAHGGGNPGFFFLPPLVANPAGNREFRDAGFAVVNPVVRICRLDRDPALGAATCAVEVVAFSGAQIRVSAADRQYQVNWDTRSSSLSTAAFYRMSVFVGNQLLGFADIDPVTPQEMRNRNTGETIALVDGRTLPIKFTIEEDGLCAGTGECTRVRVTNNGGSFTLPSGNAGIYLPAGWLPPEFTEVSLTLQRVATAGNNDCLEEGFTGAGLIRQYEGCLQIKTDPDLTGTVGIQRPAVVGLCIEIADTHPDYDLVQMFKSDAGRPIVALADADPSVIVGFTCDGFAGTPEIIGSLPGPLQQLALAAWRTSMRGLSRIELVQTLHAIDLGESGQLLVGMDFSQFGWGIRGSMSAIGSTTLSAPVGGDATLSVRVLANHLHQGAPSQNAGLPNIPVTFTIMSGTGGQLGDGQTFSAAPLTVLTGETGLAEVKLRTGATPATYVVQASATGVTAPLTFTVNSGIVTIDFETWPTSDGPCTPACALSTHYSPNAVFSFTPIGGPAATVVPAARVAGGPYHAVTNHSATAPSGASGIAVGTLFMTLGGDPTQATFRVRFSPAQTAPEVTGYGYGDGGPVAVDGAVTFTISDVYLLAGAPVREATVTVSIPSGIFRIGISGGSSTEPLYLDDLTILGAVFVPIG